MKVPSCFICANASSVGAKMVTFALGSISVSVRPASSIKPDNVEKPPFAASVTASGAASTLGASKTVSITWMMPFDATMSVVTMFDMLIMRPESPSEIIASSPLAISIELPVAAIASIEDRPAPATTW